MSGAQRWDINIHQSLIHLAVYKSETWHCRWKMLQFSSSWNIDDFCWWRWHLPNAKWWVLFGDTKNGETVQLCIDTLLAAASDPKISLIQDKVKVSTGNHFLKAPVFYSTKKNMIFNCFQWVASIFLRLKLESNCLLPIQRSLCWSPQTWCFFKLNLWRSCPAYLLISQLPLSKEYLAPPYPNARAIRGLAGSSHALESEHLHFSSKMNFEGTDRIPFWSSKHCRHVTLLTFIHICTKYTYLYSLLPASFQAACNNPPHVMIDNCLCLQPKVSITELHHTGDVEASPDPPGGDGRNIIHAHNIDYIDGRKTSPTSSKTFE